MATIASHLHFSVFHFGNAWFDAMMQSERRSWDLKKDQAFIIVAFFHAQNWWKKTLSNFDWTPET